MELAAAILGVIESVSPVNSEQTDHRQEDANTDSGAALDLERIEIAYVRPAVSSFKEEQGEYR